MKSPNTAIEPAGEYPEILTDLAGQVAELLAARGLPADQAADLGREAAEHVRQCWGGQLVYIPKGESFTLSQRDLDMWREFNGRNHAVLARKYGVSLVRVYQIVAAMKKKEVNKRQGKLF